MVKAPLYTIKGTKTGEVVLPKDLFEVKPNLKLLAQAVHVFQERSHVGLRNTKTRSEVNRTTKKVYAQKGTGGARHGSRRANLFVGGGVSLGPRPERRILELPKTLKNKAKAYAFSIKAADKEIVAVSGLSKVVKTKEAGAFLAKLTKEIGAKRFTIALSDNAKGAMMFLRNLGEARTLNYKDINAFDIWKGGLIVMDAEIFEKKEAPKQPVKPSSAKATEGQRKAVEPAKKVVKTVKKTK